MLTLISCRESSANANQFGPHRICGREEFFDGGPLGQPILIHGYNSTEPQVLAEYIPFSAALQLDCIAYSWPAGCHALDFLAAVDRARLAGYRLRDLFSMRRFSARRENIVAHSLGARVVLTALHRSGVSIDKLILMGAAVDWNVFEPGGEFESIPTDCQSVHVLYSNRDEVLKLAFPLGDLGRSFTALGLDGPRDPSDTPGNVVLHDLSTFIGAHRAYLTDPQCVALVKQLLST